MDAYDAALREWGARKIEEKRPDLAPVDRSTVTVTFDSQPAEMWSEYTFSDASFTVRLRCETPTRYTPGGVPPITPTRHDLAIYYDMEEFDLGAIIREVVEVGFEVAATQPPARQNAE